MIKTAVRKIVCLSPAWTAIVVVLSMFLQMCVFVWGWIDGIAAIAVYTFAFYSLVVLLVYLSTYVRQLIMLLRRFPLIDRLFADREFRANVTFSASTVFTLFMAVSYLRSGFINRSAWLYSIAVFYVFLAGLRLMVFRERRREIRDESHATADVDMYMQPAGESSREIRIYTLCGWALLLVNLAIGGMSFQMVRQNRTFTYGSLMIFAMAAYAFYAIITSAVNLIRFRKQERLSVRAIRSVNFTKALVSIYTLQTALLTMFSAPEEASFGRIMNAATGAVIFLLVLALGIRMILRGHALRRQFH